MKVCLIQKDVSDLDIVRHLDKVRPSSADIVCLPELAVSGCLYEKASITSLDSIVDMLSVYDFGVFIGLPRWDGNALKNSYLYSRHGQYQVYDKINLFEPMNEHVVYAPGRRPGLIETEFGRFGVAVCYDLRFPLLFDRLAESRVDWIIVPAAFPEVRINDWRSLIVERARQTGRHVIGVNAAGDDGVNAFGGNSMVVDPDGRILAEVGEEAGEIIEIEL